MRPIPSNKKPSYEGNTHRSGKNSGSRGYSGGYTGGGGGGGSGNNLVFESSGPEGKIRGTARQIAEKYMGLARDALSSGDYVAAEGFSQHAEHYLRTLSESGGGQASPFSDHKRYHKRHEGGGETTPSATPPQQPSPSSLQPSPSSSPPEAFVQVVAQPAAPAALAEPPSLPLEPLLEPKKIIKRPRRHKKPDALPTPEE